MDKKIRVLVAPGAYVINDTRVESLGTITYYILKELSQLGVETTVLTMKADIKEPIPNCKIIELLPNQNPTKINLLKFLWRYYRTGKKLLKKEHFDLVHHIFPFGFEIGFNPLLIRGLNKPFILGPLLSPHTKEVNLKNEQNITKSYGAKSVEMSLKDQLGAKVFDWLMRWGQGQALKFFQKTLKKSNWIIYGDLHTQRCYQPYDDPNKTSVLRIGIDVEKLKPIAKEPQKKKGVEILTAGFLTERKGIKYLIEGFNQIADQYPDAYITVIGYGPEKENLENLTQKLKLTNQIKFLGSLPDYNDVVKHFQTCDIFCLPALSETWVVLQEAMACGKPVIGSDTGSHPEHIIDGQAGLLVPMKNSQKVAEALEKLLKDPDLRIKMGKKARAHIEADYDWKKIGKEYLKIYEKFIED